MEWKNAKKEVPETSGAYIVSIKKEGTSGAWVFEYVAYFYAPGKKWIRYDPFADKQINTLKEEITNMVVGWLAYVPVFTG